MRVLVLGRGLLGARLHQELGGLAHERVEITDGSAVRELVQRLRPDAVINAVGKTGRPNVDWCETHRQETYRVNLVGALHVAEACAATGAHLLHLGSGCVHSGARVGGGGYTEDDAANPVSFYARTQYAADLVLSRLPGVCVARLRMPIDDQPSPRNLITKLAGYRHVIDVENSVTVVEDFVSVARELVGRRITGVVHATNPGLLRHRDLLSLYRQLVDPSHRTELIAEHELESRGLVVAARSTCVLATPRLDALGIHMRPISVALRACMLRYAQALRG